ncbi:MAG: antibiotic biosynthesis monooxygenase [Anaerolineae bacterium]|nr:antibiotic biosynthesis monooxygenase [Anaerolineae bacterium]
MYGTIARLRVKPGADLTQLEGDFAKRNVPGHIATYVWRLDSDPQTAMIVTMFESKEAYFANANSPEQHQDYLKMVTMLDGEPEWNDGVVVWSHLG